MGANAGDSRPAPRTLVELLVGTGVIATFLGAFVEEAIKAAIPEVDWRLTVLIAILLLGFTAIPVMRRARHERRSLAINDILTRRQVDRNPWKVTAAAAAALLATELLVSGVLGFLMGYFLGQALQTQEMFAAALAVLNVATLVSVLFVSVRIGQYVTHRIGGRELLWVVTAILVYRLVSLPLNLMTVPVELVPWLMATGSLVSAGWMGHRLGLRTEAQFTLSYLFDHLSPQDQAHLLDLAGSVALDPRDPPAARGGAEA